MFVVNTTGITKKAEIKWIIKNFQYEWPTKKEGEYFKSPVFHAEDDEEVKWRVKIYPYAGEDLSDDESSSEEDDDEDQVSLFLSLFKAPSARPYIVSKYTFAIYNEEEGKLIVKKTLSVPHVFKCDGTGHGFPRLASQADVLQCPLLSIICEVEYGYSKSTTTSGSLNSLALSSTVVNQSSSLVGDFGQLYPNHSSSDICFIVECREFRAHKFILSTRSPVFAAMFQHSEMKENQENRVVVQDISPDIFDALLRFLYTDQVDLSTVDATALLIAANRYLIPLLKFRCEESLSQHLTTANFSELLVLADLHGALRLKKEAEDFFRLRSTDILKTDGWKNMAQTRPDLAINMFALFQ